LLLSHFTGASSLGNALCDHDETSHARTSATAPSLGHLRMLVSASELVPFGSCV